MARADAASYRLERRAAAFVGEHERAAPRRARAAHALRRRRFDGAARSAPARRSPAPPRSRVSRRCTSTTRRAGRTRRATAAIVARACEAAGVPLHVVRLERRLSGRRLPGARARAALRARLARWRRRTATSAIVTAHNRDDQAETVLYRLTKYATPRALAGMRPRDGLLARPLLCLGAAEIRAYCAAAGIEYGEDVTNARPVYARNRLRLEVLPLLQAVNPRVVETLADAAEMAAAQEDVVAAAVAAAEAAGGRAAGRGRSGGARHPGAARRVAGAPGARAARRGAQSARRRRPRGAPRSSRRCSPSARGGTTPGASSLGRGLEAVRAGGRLRLRRREPAHACSPAALEWRGAGGRRGGGLRPRLVRSPLPRPPARAPPASTGPPPRRARPSSVSRRRPSA